MILNDLFFVFVVVLLVFLIVKLRDLLSKKQVPKILDDTLLFLELLLISFLLLYFSKLCKLRIFKFGFLIISTIILLYALGQLVLVLIPNIYTLFRKRFYIPDNISEKITAAYGLIIFFLVINFYASNKFMYERECYDITFYLDSLAYISVEDESKAVTYINTVLRKYKHLYFQETDYGYIIWIKKPLLHFYPSFYEISNYTINGLLIKNRIANVDFRKDISSFYQKKIYYTFLSLGK